MILNNFYKNLNQVYRVFMFTAVVIALFFVSSCTSYTAKLKNDGNTGNLIDEENGIYYVYCLGHIRAATIEKEPYAKVKDGEKQKLYSVTGLDPQKWLSEDITKGIPFLFREENEEEPIFEGFEPARIHVTLTETVTIAVALIDNEEDLTNISNDFLYNDVVDLPDAITENFTFNFESEKYPGIYFVLDYYIDTKGGCYLYDRWTKRSVLTNYDIYEGRGDYRFDDDDSDWDSDNSGDEEEELGEDV